MKSECDAVFLFVAELNGSFKPGTGTMEDKIVKGQMDYIIGKVPQVNLDDEEDRQDLHEVIWLERLYEELDRYFGLAEGTEANRYDALMSESYRSESYKWTVPIELDASALTKCY